MKALAVILATSLLISCGPKKPLPGPDLDVAATLEMARARPRDATDLAPHPDVTELALDDALDGTGDLGDRVFRHVAGRARVLDQV